MRVFISGLTGTIGTSLAALHRSRGDEVIGCARGEAGAQRWLADHGTLGTLLVCDAARLADRLSDAGRLLPTCGRLYHCAAMKHVDLAEANPCEAARQNVSLTALVAAACRAAGVPMVLAGTDKACLPSGVYGATKLIAERAAVAAGHAAVRLANVAGSRGSVLERWREAAAGGGKITLTDPDMTRFFMTAAEAALFMADKAVAGKVAAPWPLKAARMGDLASAFGCGVEVAGPRPGETRHQWLFSPQEKAKKVPGGWLLGEGDVTCGFSSEDAPRWDARELLEAAGVAP